MRRKKDIFGLGNFFKVLSVFFLVGIFFSGVWGVGGTGFSEIERKYNRLADEKKETTNTPPAGGIQTSSGNQNAQVTEVDNLIEKGIDEGNGEIILQMGAENSEIANVITPKFESDEIEFSDEEYIEALSSIKSVEVARLKEIYEAEHPICESEGTWCGITTKKFSDLQIEAINRNIDEGVKALENNNLDSGTVNLGTHNDAVLTSARDTFNKATEKELKLCDGDGVNCYHFEGRDLVYGNCSGGSCSSFVDRTTCGGNGISNCQEMLEAVLEKMENSVLVEKSSVFDFISYDILEAFGNPDQKALVVANEIFKTKDKFSFLDKSAFLRNIFGGTVAELLCQKKFDGFFDEQETQTAGVTKFGCQNSDSFEIDEIGETDIRTFKCSEVVYDLRGQRGEITPDKKMQVDISYYYKGLTHNPTKLLIYMRYFNERKNKPVVIALLPQNFKIVNSGEIRSGNIAKAITLNIDKPSDIRENSFMVGIVITDKERTKVLLKGLADMVPANYEAYTLGGGSYEGGSNPGQELSDADFLNAIRD